MQPTSDGEVDLERRHALARRSIVVSALAGAVAVVLGVGLLERVGDPDEVAAPPPRPVASVSPTVHADRAPAVVTDQRVNALRALLVRRTNAVLRHDRGAWMATVDARSGDFRRRQEEVFDRFDALPITGWRYQADGSRGRLEPARQARLGPDAWVAGVRLTYALGEGGAPVERSQHLTMVRRDGRWLVASDEDDTTDRDLWDLTDVAVEQGSRSLVIGTRARRVSLARYARETDEAARRVDTVWGTDWPRQVVVVVPQDTPQMAEVLGRGVGGLEQLAALTTGPAGRPVSEAAAAPAASPNPSPTSTAEVRGSADRVVVNPDAFDTFDVAGRRIILTHEVTHVATRATTSLSPPLWLSEGFADYVAFTGSGLTQSAIAGELVAQVRAGRVPDDLPQGDDFDATQGSVDAAYEGSWLAVDLIARNGGPSRAVRFYRAVSQVEPQTVSAADEALDAAFQNVLGESRASFVRRWRSYVEEVART